METDFENKLGAIYAHFREYTRGWNDWKLRDRILDIQRFVNFNSERYIPLATRRKIARRAQALLESLDGFEGLSRMTRLELEGLADSAHWVGRGGDHRSGQHSMEASVVRMIVRAYADAHPDPGFSKGGPLVRFVHDVCSLLTIERPSENAIRAALRKILKEANAPRP